jgi:type II secretory pathway pseudopilin PulG
MPVDVLLIVVIVLFVASLWVADRALKAIRRVRRRREANRRLTAAAAQAETREGQRRAATEASGALTSLMPTIHDLPPRHVE